MGRKRTTTGKQLPERWTQKHGAFYYITRESERAIFDNKKWFRLGATYHEALKAYAERLELKVGDNLSSVMDRYVIEVLPDMSANTNRQYLRSIDRLRSVLGHNKASLVSPQLVYQYMEHIARLHSKNTANIDLKVLKQVLGFSVRWGVIAENKVRNNVQRYNKRDGIKGVRKRYVEDWELAAWSEVASPVQRAFAALVLMTGASKAEVFALTRNDIKDGHLRFYRSKTDAERLFVITPALQNAINLALSTHTIQSIYLLPNSKGQCYMDSTGQSKVFDNNWNRSMLRAIKATDLEESFTRHDLRAKVGSDADSDERAQQLLGHTSSTMTRKHYRRKLPIIAPTS